MLSIRTTSLYGSVVMLLLIVEHIKEELQPGSLFLGSINDGAGCDNMNDGEGCVGGSMGVCLESTNLVLFKVSA